MDESLEQIIKVNKHSEALRNKLYLSSKQKLVILIIFILIALFLYNISFLKEYYIKNINKKIINENIKTEKSNEIYKLKKVKNNNGDQNKSKKKIKNKKNNSATEGYINFKFSQILKEVNIEKLYEINKKRTFEKRYPLPEEIKCQEHLREGGLLDMMAFTSFLTKNTTFFEFASGCSSIIAKYYSKKSYAVEGNKKWYDIGINNGLKDNLLFKDLKCDGTGPLLSWPGKNSTIEDWKNFIQAYKKEYNADVIFVDGRFRVACIFDIFNKIRNDTIVLLHECHRSQYSVVKDYYYLVYHWGSLCLFQKKNLSEIPIEIQKKYWTERV